MNKWMKAVCALLLLFMEIGLFGTGARASLAQNQNDAAQVGSPFVPGRILVQFRPEITKSLGRRLIAQAGAQDAGEIPGIGVHILELPEAADEEAFARAFKSRPEVEFAELDRILSPTDMTPNDPWYANWEWGLRKISGPTAWQATTGSNEIIIAILDSGIDSNHEDLGSKLVPGWNTYNNNSDVSDVRGHGTKVAGTAAAISNNGMGVASVAWGCRLMPVRVSGTDGTAPVSAIADGLTWAADHGARVANVSYQATNSSTVATAARYFQTKGGVVTISSGNDGLFDNSADNPYVLTVGATDLNDLLYSWSTTGNNVDVVAPGSTYTTLNGGGYSSAAGTSISAPMVAGVAALVFSVNPNLTGSQAQDIVKQSADDLGSAGWDTNFGWGRVNAARAVSLATGGGATTDTTPPTVSFSSPGQGGAVSGTVTVSISSADNVGISSVNLKVDGASLGNDTVAPYGFSWNTSSLSNGQHTLTATASDAAGNTSSASISVTVGNFSDTTPPTVTIASPVTGGSVTGTVSILVNADDAVRVTKLELYVDGRLASTATSSPFTNKWNTRKVTAGAHTLQCKAYDAAGNIGLSNSVTVYR